MNGNDRNLVKMIKQIAIEDDIKIVGSRDGWIFRLTKNNMNKHIIGHRFELNSKGVNALCDHKSSASEILQKNNVEVVEHISFPSPVNNEDLSQYEYLDKMKQYLSLHKKIVIKPNDGSMGYNVERVNTEKELEEAIIKISKMTKEIALSPYYEIKNEYRVIILDDEIKLVYLKEVPSIIGNGKDSIRKLIDDNIQVDDNLDIDYVPKNNELVILNWKHNSTYGSSGKIIDDPKIINKLTKLSIKTSEALDLVFASIDIVEVDNKYMVLEINAGVMMEHFSSLSEENYKKAKEIYNDAIDLMFGEY